MAVNNNNNNSNNNKKSGSLKDDVIHQRFHVLKKLGAGSFGEIYEVQDLKTNIIYAMKVERIDATHPQLKFEYSVYVALTNCQCFPNAYTFVNHKNAYNVLVMDKLGESLEQLFTLCGRRFTLKCVCFIALEILQRIETLHNKGYLHRDIKPDNFLIGNNDRTNDKGKKIYMIDLGLCKVWREGNRHIPFREGKRLIGTPRYASINTHFGLEQSRRDDLESLGYMLMYFIVGQLPWQGLNGATKEEKYQKIGQKKSDTSLELLCRGQPKQLIEYFTYCRKLKFETAPNYNYLQSLFKNILTQDCQSDFRNNDFDWLHQEYIRRSHNKTKSNAKLAQKKHGNLAGKTQPRQQIVSTNQRNFNRMTATQQQQQQQQHQIARLRTQAIKTFANAPNITNNSNNNNNNKLRGRLRDNTRKTTNTMTTGIKAQPPTIAGFNAMNQNQLRNQLVSQQYANLEKERDKLKSKCELLNRQCIEITRKYNGKRTDNVRLQEEAQTLQTEIQQLRKVDAERRRQIETFSNERLGYMRTMQILQKQLKAMNNNNNNNNNNTNHLNTNNVTKKRKYTSMPLTTTTSTTITATTPAFFIIIAIIIVIIDSHRCLIFFVIFIVF